jgi:hypothetical protein
MRNASRIAAGLGFWVATGVSGAALAQCADKLEPDKDRYWVLNPVPDDQMRNFSTDRPTKSNVPCTVDAGHFQYETDIVNFTHQVTGSVHTDTLLVPNPTFKVGLTNNIDLELNIAPVVGVHTFNSAPLVSSTTWGNGDLFVRSKVNLWGDDGGGTSAFALIPYIKAPTAPTGIGNGTVEGGVIAPLAFSLPNGTTLCWCRPGSPQRHDPLAGLDAVDRRARADGFGDEARGQMTVVVLDHPRILVPKVLRHDQQRHSGHHGQRCPGVAQDVEADRGYDPGMLTGFAHRPALLRLLPRRAVGMAEHWFAARTTGAVLMEEARALLRQHDMARLAAL